MSAARRIELQADGISVPGLEAGSAERTQAVLFVHGNPGSSTDWSALLEGVGDFGRAVALDMPGFGQAPVPAGFDYRVDSYARFLQDAVQQLGIEQVHLVVHDFGGPFGLTWGMTHPEVWKSVVLINIGVLPGYRWHVMARRWRTPLLGELMQAWIPRWGWRRAMASANPKGLPIEFVDKMYDDYDRTTRDTVLRLYRATPDPKEMAETVGAALAQQSRPALVIWGAQDPYLDVSYAERQREFFDVRDVLVLPDSGHWPFQDDPVAVAGAVLPFLQECLAE